MTLASTLFILSFPFVPTALAQVSAPSEGRFDPHHTVRIDIGDLVVVVGDHYEHEKSGRENYTGLHHLSHRLRASNVFCPLYAGMIGVRKACRIETTGSNSARIVAGEGSQRVVESFTVVPPHYIDYSATFVPSATKGFWNNTSYMNGPADRGIYVRGLEGVWVRHFSEKHGFYPCVAPLGMRIPKPAQLVPDSPYPHGSAHFHEGFSDLRFDPDWPVYFGRFDDMVLIFMMERRLGLQFIPYMSPTGGGHSEEFDRPNPAWDHRFHLEGLSPGVPFTLLQRVCYKPWIGEADIESEYEAWLKTLGD